MGIFEGKVVVVTGSGAGIGREHALGFASEGAKVVVNDLGTSRDGAGNDQSAAQAVVDEILAAGGAAVANTNSVSDWRGAEALIDLSVESFGGLDIVVNNAGFVRDGTIVNMTEADFDAVVEVHLKGTFAVNHWAAVYWRNQSKAGADGPRRIVNTTSHSGLFGNAGQANYASAKMGIVGLTLVCARELERYGVHANAVAPLGRTRMTTGTPGFEDALSAPSDTDAFDVYHPANNTPLVMLLAADACPFNGQVFESLGGRISVLQAWTPIHTIDENRRLSVEELLAASKDWPVGLPVQPGL